MTTIVLCEYRMVRVGTQKEPMRKEGENKVGCAESVCRAGTRICHGDPDRYDHVGRVGSRLREGKCG